jgi:hypothetical protein
MENLWVQIMELRFWGGERSRKYRDRWNLFQFAIFCRGGECSFRGGSRGVERLEGDLLGGKGELWRCSVWD